MFKTIINAFKIKDIRNRLLFTLLCLVIVRLGCLIPVPGINPELFKDWIATNQIDLGFLDTLTGGSFTEMSIFALNITPYITSSIIMQLLTIAIPKLEEMQKEGEDGRKKIASISRYLTIVLALIEATAMGIGFGRGGQLTDGSITFLQVVVIAISFTAGSAFVMWIGEKITDKGVGNGISIVLLINIIARLPQDLSTLVNTYVIGAEVVKAVIAAILIALVIIVIVALIVLLQDGERRVPVQYAKKVQGRKLVGGNQSYIPIKVNTAGVIPVIFAMSLFQFPIIISSFFGVSGSATGSVWQKILYALNQRNWFDFSSGKMALYSIGLIIYLALILFFAYFYTSVTFNPIEIANNMKKNGGVIPAIRPGKPTIDYLTAVVNRVIFIGAAGLIIVTIIPIAVTASLTVQISFAATSVIIVVGVILETMKQIESQMLVRHYKGFLSD